MNRPEVELTGDSETVREVVREHAVEFASRGFDFVGVTLEGAPKLERFPVFHFRNLRTGIVIDISFSTAREGRNGGFTLLIMKPPNRKLDVEDYLRLHGREELTQYFTYRDPTTDVRSFAGSLLKMFCLLLDEDLRSIRNGEVFEETPIDWMGYK